MSDLVVHNAQLVWNGHDESPDETVAIVGGRVAADAPSDAPTLDATGCIVIPGLINAHHHLLQTAFRTVPGTRNVSMSQWLSAMAASYDRTGVDPELTGAAAAVGIAEGLLNGVTTVADHHLTWPDAVDPVELAAATIDAATSLGGRLAFVRGTAGDSAASAAASLAAMAERWGAISPDGMLQLATGPAGVHSDGEATFRALAEVAASFGLQRRTQANEQVDVERSLQQYGKRPLALLGEWDWLEPGVTIAHLCDITTDERTALTETGITATHAPGCDVPMGWGVAEVGRLVDDGIAVGIGTSGGGSNDAGHLLADMRLAMQVSGLTDRPISARETLAMATTGSAIGLGRTELGHLMPGAAGDLICYDVTGPADAGVADPLAGLLWASPGRRPRHVVVAGRIVVHEYELQTADAAELAARLNELIDSRAG